jgi:superfamily II DNA or RNA helicase
MKELRLYQQNCIDASVKKYNEGITKQLNVLFTGAGKTFLTIKLLEQYGFKRVLWLSFQEELVSQSALAFIRDKFDTPFYNHVKQVGFLNYVKQDGGLFALKDFKLGCIKGDIWKVDARCIMGSVMTVHRRLDRLAPDYFDCIVCDEAHLYGSLSAYKIIQHFTPKLLLGLTATPHRVDGMMMGDIFDEIVFEYGLDKGIKDGYACELDAVRVKTKTSLDNVRTTAGELNQKDLSDEINTLSRNQLIVDSYKKYCDGRQTIAFCTNIKHAIDLAEQFKLNGLDCAAVSSDEELTPDRSVNINKFKEGKLPIITNVGILVAGFDHVDTGAIIMASPTKSLTKYLQSIGRGARLKTDEFVSKFGQKCVILDIVDSTSRHNLVNCWELDKQKPPEERTFITAEKREKLINERKAKLEHQRKEDEVVKLLAIPKFKLNKHIGSKVPASEAQLKWIKDLGYDVENISFTHAMCSEIITGLPATPKQVAWMRYNKFDVNSKTVITRGEAELARKQIEKLKPVIK